MTLPHPDQGRPLSPLWALPDDHPDLDIENIYGEQVTIVRTLANGQIERVDMPFGLAVEDILYNPDNGTRIVSAHLYTWGLSDLWSYSP